MAPHSSTLAWKIPWAEDPGRLQSMGSLRVGHDWATSLSLFTFMHWRRKWQPTPVFLPGESQGRGSLLGCSPRGCEELDTSERLHFHFSLSCIGEGNCNPLQCFLGTPISIYRISNVYLTYIYRVSTVIDSGEIADFAAKVLLFQKRCNRFGCLYC